MATPFRQEILTLEERLTSIEKRLTDLENIFGSGTEPVQYSPLQNRSGLADTDNLEQDGKVVTYEKPDETVGYHKMFSDAEQSEQDVDTLPDFDLTEGIDQEAEYQRQESPESRRNGYGAEVSFESGS